MTYYLDWNYEDLPESAKKAAAAMGYTPESWDGDESVPYDGVTKFDDLTLSEKRAGVFLGHKPFAKLDIWWEDASKDVQKHALQIGYSQELWDDDWEITDLPIEHKYWKDLTADEQEGATFFGYTQSTWDEVEDGDFQDDGKSSSSSSKPTKHHSKPSKVHHSKPHNNNKPSEEKKDDDDDDETKHKIKTSRAYGGDGGGPFTTKAGTIVKMIVHGNAVVEGLSVEFRNGQKQHFGSDDGGKDHEFALERGECIIKVEVRHERLVQSLTFYTNRDHKFGPFGGRGRMLKDKAGEVSEVRAPPGYRLVGLTGRVGKMVDAVAFRWGAINH